jgi:hypothetical protein
LNFLYYKFVIYPLHAISSLVQANKASLLASGVILLVVVVIEILTRYMGNRLQPARFRSKEIEKLNKSLEVLSAQYEVHARKIRNLSPKTDGVWIAKREMPGLSKKMGDIKRKREKLEKNNYVRRILVSPLLLAPLLLGYSFRQMGIERWNHLSAGNLYLLLQWASLAVFLGYLLSLAFSLILGIRVCNPKHIFTNVGYCLLGPIYGVFAAIPILLTLWVIFWGANKTFSIELSEDLMIWIVAGIEYLIALGFGLVAIEEHQAPEFPEG